MTDYTGHMDKVDGAIVARLVDKWGHVINITATPDPAGGYMLAGVAGPPPPDLWVEAIDGERAG